jgi:Secretion system C-terminal sorting domain
MRYLIFITVLLFTSAINGQIDLKKLNPEIGLNPAVQIPLAKTTPTDFNNVRIFSSSNNQSEVSVSGSMLNTNDFVAGANTDPGQGFYYSTDGTLNWNGSDHLLNTSVYASDPSLTFDLNGNAYFNYLDYVSGRYNLYLSKSSDGGINWQAPTRVDVNNQKQPDKNYMTIDQNQNSPYKNNIYCVWTEFSGSNPIIFARSTNGGGSFIGHLNISGGSTIVQAAVPAVGPNGEVYVVWGIGNPNETGIGFNKSTNGGASFIYSNPPTVSTVTQIGTFSNNRYRLKITSQYPDGIRVNSFPSVAVDRSGGSNNGTIYIVWADQRTSSPGSGTPDILLIKSIDQGSTWSQPIRVNDVTTGDQWMPWVDVGPDGAVNIVFYDSRNDPDNFFTEVYVARSNDGGQSFVNYKVSDVQFAPVAIPGYASGYMGDYIGIASGQGKAYPVWMDNRANGIYQLFTAVVAPSEVVVTIDQRNSNNQQIGLLKKYDYETSNWSDPFNPGTQFPFPVNSNQTILGDQTIISNQKYEKWATLISGDEPNVINHHSFITKPSNDTYTSRFIPTQPGVTIKNSLEGTDATGGYLDFRDPWLIDSIDASHGNQVMNRGMDHVIWHQRNSPFHPDYTTSYGGYTYKGVFLDQAIGPNKTYYNCWSGDQQIPVSGIGTRNFYFQGWTATGANLQFYGNEAWTEFTSSNAVVKAILKGQGLSGDVNAFNSSSERKFVQSRDGTLFSIYSSMNGIWLERSTDAGNWVFQKDTSLNYNTAKGPSIYCSWHYSRNYPTVSQALVVFQEKSGNDSYIKMLYLETPYQPDDPNDVGPWSIMDTKSFLAVSGHYDDINCTPVVSFDIGSAGDLQKFTVVYKGLDGLYYQKGTVAAHYPNVPQPWGITLTGSPAKNTGTSSTSVNPSICAAFGSGNGDAQLVWSQDNTIKYINTIPAVADSIKNISNGDGYSGNGNSSLVVLGDNYARVSWRGSYCYYQEDTTVAKDNPFCYSHVVFKGTNNSRFWVFGNNVGSPNIDKSDDDNYYGFAWSENDGVHTYFADNSLSTIREIGVPGKYIQVCNGPSKDKMYAEVFNTGTAPYSFSTSNSLGSYYMPQKITTYSFSSGREGVLYKDTAQFFFTVGDVSVEGEPVDFIEVPDTLNINTKDLMNEYLKTDDFQLTDNSAFLYSVEYGIADSAAAVNLLGGTDKYVSYNLQLVDAQTSEVLGNYDEVVYDQSNLPVYNNYSYQVNTQGIGNRTVYLRLIVDDNFDPNYSMGELHAIGNTLQKTSVKNRNYRSGEIVKTYDLFQNYPNPFNPSTKISFQIPKPGNVVLKIYDILGREVMTLVNGYKNVGRYKIDFNASNLASGVYIYRLVSGDFVSVKKMVLLK